MTAPRYRRIALWLTVALAGALPPGMAAQGAPPASSRSASTAADPTPAVQAREDAFWRTYNACDTAAFRGFFAADVEFYHDRGGPTIGLEAFDAALSKNLCGGGNRLRREPVEGTVRLSILRNGDTVYGAIVAGEHVFYVREPGKAEFLDGRRALRHLVAAEGRRLEDGAAPQLRPRAGDALIAGPASATPGASGGIRRWRGSRRAPSATPARTSCQRAAR